MQVCNPESLILNEHVIVLYAVVVSLLLSLGGLLGSLLLGLDLLLTASHCTRGLFWKHR